MLLGRQIGVVWHGPLVLGLFQLIARRKSNLLSKRVESISFSLRQRVKKEVIQSCSGLGLL